MTGTITVTASSGTAVVGLQWELGRGGVADDGTTWLGGGSTYPGSIVPFQARNADGTNDYQNAVQLLSVNWATAVDADTLTLSGDVTSVIQAVGNAVDNAGDTAAMDLGVAGLVLTLNEGATAGAPVSVDCSLLILCV